MQKQQHLTNAKCNHNCNYNHPYSHTNHNPNSSLADGGTTFLL